MKSYFLIVYSERKKSFKLGEPKDWPSLVVQGVKVVQDKVVEADRVVNVAQAPAHPVFDKKRS